MKEQKIEVFDKKIGQLEAQKQALIAREKEKERKARTRRLIQIGGIMAHIGIDSVEKADQVKKAYEENVQFRTYMEKIIGGSN